MAEYRAINTVFNHSDLRINATKSMIGQCCGVRDEGLATRGRCTRALRVYVLRALNNGSTHGVYVCVCCVHV